MSKSSIINLCFVFLAVILPLGGALAGQIANVEYVHGYIYQATGIDVEFSPDVHPEDLDEHKAKAVNVKYLLAAIDALNEINGVPTFYRWDTDYATEQAADVDSVWKAVYTLSRCVWWYYKDGAIDMYDGTGGVQCVRDVTTPSSCASHTETINANEDTVSDCTGGSMGGVAISSFVVGAYCSTDVGEGSFGSPIVQNCPNCKPATNQAGTYCYCRINSINGNPVPSSYFISDGNYNVAYLCNFNCSRVCSQFVPYSTNTLSALFDALLLI